MSERGVFVKFRDWAGRMIALLPPAFPDVIEEVLRDSRARLEFSERMEHDA